MGIKGLKQLLSEQCSSAWKAAEDVRGDLVIDGNNLCHELYCPKSHCFENLVKLDWVNGGQYCQYYKQTLTFFEALQSKGITPHVVFDGVNKMNKLTPDVIIKKMKRREHDSQKELKEKPPRSTSGAQLPHLVYTVLHNVLKACDVKMYVGNGEGDETCAQIANYFNCPVLSGDSDFFLFNLSGGYIHLDYLLNWKEGNVRAIIYYRELLFSLDYFLQSDILFLIQAILDTLDKATQREMLKQLPYDKKEDETINFALLVKTLRSRSLPTCIESISNQETQAKLKEVFLRVQMYFNTPNVQNPSDLCKAPLPSCPGLPKWLVEEYRQHNIPHLIMDAKVNGKQHHSSSLTSLHIRQCSYSILGVQEVKEYHVGECGPYENRIPCASVKCPSLDQIPKMSLDDRRCSLLSMLGCISAKLETVEENDKLFLCSVIYWRREKNVKTFIVQALLACSVLCSEEVKCVPSIKEKYRKEGSWLQDRKSFLEWQCVYNDMVALNSLLRRPFEVRCPHSIYNGMLAMTLASQMDIDSVCNPRVREKYKELFQIVVTET